MLVTPQHKELTPIEWKKARKDMALGRLTDTQWDKASKRQKYTLHQIELTIESLSIEDLEELEE